MWRIGEQATYATRNNASFAQSRRYCQPLAFSLMVFQRFPKRALEQFSGWLVKFALQDSQIHRAFAGISMTVGTDNSKD